MVIYNDDEILEAVCSTLVVRVDSINKAFGSVAKFCEDYNLQGVTNGKLWMTSVMFSLYDSIFEVERNLLEGFNLKEGEDFIYFQDELFYGVKYRLNENAYKELPATKNINWLKSILLPCGNYVWFTDPSRPAFEHKNKLFLIRLFYELNKDKNINTMNIRLVNETEEHFFFKAYTDDEYAIAIPKDDYLVFE
jgi:hypothetical protein